MTISEEGRLLFFCLLLLPAREKTKSQPPLSPSVPTLSQADWQTTKAGISFCSLGSKQHSSLDGSIFLVSLVTDTTFVNYDTIFHNMWLTANHLKQTNYQFSFYWQFVLLRVYIKCFKNCQFVWSSPFLI